LKEIDLNIQKIIKHRKETVQTDKSLYSDDLLVKIWPIAACVEKLNGDDHSQKSI